MIPTLVSTLLACLVSAAFAQHPVKDATELLRAQGKKIEDAINKRSVAFFRAQLDTESFGKKVAQGIDMPEAALAQMRQQIQLVTGSAIVRLAGGRAKLLRVVRQGDHGQAIVRLLRREGPLDYLVFDLRVDSGKVLITDVHTTRGGEPLSQMEQRSFSNSLFGSSRKQWNVLEFSRLVALGKNEEALSAFAKLRGRDKHRQEVLYQRLSAAWQVGRQAVMAAAKDIVRYVRPTEPSRALQMYYVYSATNEIDKALACLDRLAKWTGDDPFLDVERAQTLLKTGKVDRAQVSAKRVIDREPELIQGYLVHIEATLRARKHQATADMLKAMEKHHEIPLQFISELDGFDVFRVSDVGRTWYDSYRARKAGAKPGKR